MICLQLSQELAAAFASFITQPVVWDESGSDVGFTKTVLPHLPKRF